MIFLRSEPYGRITNNSFGAFIQIRAPPTKGTIGNDIIFTTTH